MKTPIERIASKSRFNGETGCIECDLYHDKDGYSTVRVLVDGAWRMRRVHRVVFEALVGPIPGEMTVDHICKNKACCRIDHLRLLSHVENSAGSSTAMVNKAKTRCPKGHAYDEKNTYRRIASQRDCRRCSADRRTIARNLRAKTHCPKGHAYDGTRNSSGRLMCLECKRLGISNKPLTR